MTNVSASTLLSVIAFTLLALPGCKKRWRETEVFGAVTVEMDWVSLPLAWESSGTGVERWTVRVGDDRLVLQDAAVYEAHEMVFVKTVDMALMLDAKTGAPAPCVDCNCEQVTTPLGPALSGNLTSWHARNGSESFATYPERNTSLICIVRFGDQPTYHARRFGWSPALGLHELLVRPTGAPLALGCGEIARDGSQSCSLLELTEGLPRTIQTILLPTRAQLEIAGGDHPRIIVESITR